VCHKTFSIANMGLRQILSHAEAEKHKSNINNLKGQSVFKAVTPVPVSMPASPCVASHEECPATQCASATAADVVLVCPKTQFGKSWAPISLDDKVKIAEILFVASSFQQLNTVTLWTCARVLLRTPILPNTCSLAVQKSHIWLYTV